MFNSLSWRKWESRTKSQMQATLYLPLNVMYLFRKIVTLSYGLGNVSSIIPLYLGCTYSPVAKKSSHAIKLCLFRQNHRFQILGSHVASIKARFDTSILNPLFSECSPVKFMENQNVVSSWKPFNPQKHSIHPAS